MAWIIAAVATAFLFLVPAYADEAIEHVNNQQSLLIGIAPLHASEFARAAQGASLTNAASGARYLFGYDTARTRTLLGIPDLYTDLEVSLAGGTLRYKGSSIATNGASTAALTESTTYVQDAIRMRIGRSLQFLGMRSVVLTPFLGISQLAWSRDLSASGIGNFYDHQGIEAGLMIQASLPYRLVLGVDASAGRTLGAMLANGGSGNLVYAGTSSFALKLDHRTYGSWHQRLEIRQTFLRYGQFPDVVGFFEPRRTSDLAIMLEFGTEGSIF